MNQNVAKILEVGRNARIVKDTVQEFGESVKDRVYTSVNSQPLYKVWASNGRGSLWAIHAQRSIARPRPGVWKMDRPQASCYLCHRGFHFSWGRQFWGSDGWLPNRSTVFVSSDVVVVARVAVRQLAALSLDKGVAGEIVVINYLRKDEIRGLAAKYKNKESLYL